MANSAIISGPRHGDTDAHSRQTERFRKGTHYNRVLEALGEVHARVVGEVHVRLVDNDNAVELFAQALHMFAWNADASGRVWAWQET